MGVSALDALASPPRTGAAGVPDLASLARLLTYGAGVLRGRTFGFGEQTFFRTYASAGALYPNEVYVVCGALPGLSAGVYHFDPLDRSLVLLREGDRRGQLVRAAAAEPAVAAAPAVLVLTGIPWRTAWKYGDRGYRHVFWDAGMILANLLALAASSGLAARVVLGFADSEVEALLGLDAREFPCCLVPLGKGPPVPAAGTRSAEDPIPARPLSSREREFPAIRRASDAGRLLSAEDITAWREAGGGLERAESWDEQQPIVPGAVQLRPDSLEEVIRRRGSARAFGKGTMPAGVLAMILDRSTGGVSTDYSPRGAAVVQPYVIANGVDGLDPGAYLYRFPGFRLLRTGGFRREAGYLCLEQRLAADAAATHFLMVDLDRVLEVLGDRGYRAAQLEAAITAGRLYLAAYAELYGATGLTFYDEEVRRFLCPEAPGCNCMLVVATGESVRPLAPSR